MRPDWLRLSLSCSLIAAGAVAAVVHVVFTPLLPSGEGFVAVASSSAFLWRQILSCVTAILIMFGAAEILFLLQSQAPRWSGLAAAAAMVGSAALVAQEWGQIFIVRTMAFEIPGPLMQMDSADGMSLYDIGALIALGAFALGCLAMAGAALLTKGRSKLGPALVVAGLFLVPILTVLAHKVGSIVGNVIMDAGWMIWGLARYRAARAKSA